MGDMPNFLLKIAALTAFSGSLIAQLAPVAEKKPSTKTVNGVTMVDDYAWLRERKDPAVLAYLNAENAYAEQVTASEKPLAEKLYQETLSHIQADG